MPHRTSIIDAPFAADLDVMRTRSILEGGEIMLAIAIAGLLLQAEPTDEDWQWLAAHRDAALEHFMPLGDAGATTVAFRSYRDLYQDVPERYFRIYDIHPVRAVAVWPDKTAIQQQMLNLHMADRTAPFDAILSKVRVETVETTELACPAIRAALKSLAKVSVRVPKLDVIVIHPPINRVIVQGESTLDATVTSDTDPLAKWAIDTAAKLRLCH